MRNRPLPALFLSAALACLIACGATPALAQSMGESHDASNAAVAASASAEEQVRAEVNAGVEQVRSSPGHRSSSGAGMAASARLSGNIGPRMAHASAALARTQSPSRYGDRLGSPPGQPRERKGELAVGRVSRSSAYRTSRALNRPSAAKTAKARLALDSALVGAKPRAVREPASYSTGFQDSTRGTALISPPDPGTDGPFGFHPGVGAGLPDFANRQFLAPSLHVGGLSTGRRRGRRGAEPVRAQTPAVLLPGSLSATPAKDLGLDLGLDVLHNDLDLGASSLDGLNAGGLDTSLPGSVNPQ